MVKNDFSGYSHGLNNFGENKINSYGPKNTDGDEELPDTACWSMLLHITVTLMVRFLYMEMVQGQERANDTIATDVCEDFFYV